jgi:hypothetical protein
MTLPAFSGWKPCFSADHKQFLADHLSVRDPLLFQTLHCKKNPKIFMTQKLE